jgi:hypothetical protein
MATRGQIAYLANPNTINTIYVHYDAYPEALGKTLNTIFNSESDAESLVMDGNDIRFIDNDGTVDRFDKGSYKVIKGEEPEELFSNLYSHSDRAAADYVYVWLEDKWVTLKVGKGRNYFVGTLLDQTRKMEPTMEEGVSEDEEDVLGDWISDMLKYKSYDEVVKTVRKALRDALMDDELVAKVKADKKKKETPEIPGFEGTKDELDNLFEEEYQKRQWQHRAGIIK